MQIGLRFFAGQAKTQVAKQAQTPKTQLQTETSQAATVAMKYHMEELCAEAATAGEASASAGAASAGAASVSNSK